VEQDELMEQRLEVELLDPQIIPASSPGSPRGWLCVFRGVPNGVEVGGGQDAAGEAGGERAGERRNYHHSRVGRLRRAVGGLRIREAGAIDVQVLIDVKGPR